MEYTFKNSISEKACTVLLDKYQLIVQLPDKKQVIPYASIMEIRLSKGIHGFFKVHVCADNQSRVVITNQYALQGGKFEDRSRQYATFIRVLHFHLKDKSQAKFISGSNLSLLLTCCIVSVAASFLISIVASWLYFNSLNPWITGLSMGGLAVAAILIFNLKSLPKPYTANDIPLQFLP